MFAALITTAIVAIIVTAAVIGTLIHMDNRVTPADVRLRIAAEEVSKQNYYNDTYGTFGGRVYRHDGGPVGFGQKY